MRTTEPRTGHGPKLQDRRKVGRRLHDLQLLQRERELAAARHITETLFRHVTLDRLVEETLRTALKVVDAESGSILLAKPDGRHLEFCYSIGAKPVPQGTVIPVDRGIAGAVFRSGRPQVIVDVKRDPRHYSGIDHLTGYRSRDMVCLPLKRWTGKPIGVLQVLNKHEGRLGEEDLAILTLVSALASMEIERARLYEETRLAEVIRLVGDISHDLKNLLMPFLTGTGALQGEITDLLAILPAKAKAHRAHVKAIMGMLIETAGRIKFRMQEISDCVQGRSAPVRFAPCRIGELVAEAYRPLAMVAEEKHVALRMKGLARLPPVLADERRLFNAFYNLVSNALAEVPCGGSVTVAGTLDRRAGALTLKVSDTGRGMPPEVRDSLFTEHTISRKAGGTGLGTRIVKDVIDAHGGHIAVRSREGVGTTFTIRLPLRPSGKPRISVS